MKRVASIVPLLVIGCGGTSTTSDIGPVAGCDGSDCFFQRDVRDFEVVDRERLVVYVGQQRCPFLVEVQDVGCNVSFTPEVEFFQTALGRIDRLAPIRGGQVCATTRGLVLYSGVVAPSLLRQREELESGLGGRRPQGGFGRAGTYEGSFPVDPTSNDMCRVRTVRAINDDELIELYAEVGAPPPPVGGGQLEVPEEAPEEARDEAASTGGAGGPPAE